jgi:hypothetical protein
VDTTEPDLTPLTQQQATKYLEAGGAYCPFCNGNDVDCGCVSSDYGALYQRMTCRVCSHTWVESYSLVGIMDENDPSAEFLYAEQQFRVQNYTC